MNRRTLLAGLGGLAGTGSIVSSGAFTSVTANRNVSVAVANDTDAFLAMRPCEESPNAAYVQTEGGLLTLDLTGDNPTNADGMGVNADAISRFDRVFEMQNQGTQPVGVWLDIPAVETTPGGDPRIEFYLEDDPSTEIVASDGDKHAKCLGVGDSLCIGFIIRTQGLEAGADEEDLFEEYSGGELVVNADAEVACSPPTTAGELVKVWASGAISNSNGAALDDDGQVADARRDPTAALGPVHLSKYPTGSYGYFYSLGFGTEETQPGEIVLEFSGTLVRNPNADDLVVYEATNGNRNSYGKEGARVFVQEPGSSSWIEAGVATSRGRDGSSNTGVNGFSFPGSVNQVERVKLVDDSDPSNFSSSPTSDGFDVDGVSGWIVQ